MKITLKRETIEISARKVGFFGKIRGLMFRSRNCENLLFEFSSWEKFGIHSFFVFFPFLAIWLDKQGAVVDWEVVRPWKLVVEAKKNAVRLLEVPLSSKNRRVFEFFRR